jgi:hypothetical protein
MTEELFSVKNVQILINILILYNIWINVVEVSSQSAVISTSIIPNEVAYWNSQDLCVTPGDVQEPGLVY